MDNNLNEIGKALIIGGLIIYFLPFYIALIRSHYRKTLIFFLNLIVGWSGIGWVIVLIYSLISKSRKTLHEINSEYT